MRRRTLLIGAAVAVVALAGCYAVLRGDARAPGEPYRIPTATAQQLAEAAEARVFFAHQSVGVNILDAVPAVYRDQGLEPPGIAGLAGANDSDRLRHERVGQNGDPLGKLAEFEALVRGGLGEEVDVASLKLCYSDVRAGDDAGVIFGAYRDTFAELQRDYPEVSFVPATVPLNITRGPRARLNALLGRPDRFGPEHNVVREELNALLRAEYADGPLFDVAAIESTEADGERVARYHDGERYYALSRDYAADSGHLDEDGGAVVAEAFLAVLADAARD